jgi:CRP/FNR family transcriptional regulator, anaerobic regulatory protein
MYMNSLWIRQLKSLFPKKTITHIPKKHSLTLQEAHFSILLSGSANIYLVNHSLSSQMLFEPLRPHECLIHPLKPLCFKIYSKQSCQLISLDALELKKWQSVTPEISDLLLEKHTSLQKSLMMRISWQNIHVIQRIYYLIFEHYKDEKEIHLNHNEIAMMIGSSRETVSRQLKKLANRGLIITRSKCIRKTTALSPHLDHAGA